MAKNLGKIIMTVLIVIVMISSVIGFVFSDISMGGSNTNSLSYNGFTFTQTNTGFQFKINNNNLFSPYLPSQVDYIAVNSSVIEPLKASRMAYITSDANSTEAVAIAGFSYTVSQALNAKGSYGQTAFISKNQYSKPVITCKDATQFVPVILVQEADTSDIQKDGNCIIVNAMSSSDFERLGSRLSYGILGVIE
jgi:hypothetical protein